MSKTKYICFLLALFLIAAGCTSSKKLLEKGKYDKAIEKSAKELRKDPGDTDELYVLREAYKQANLFDKGQIDFLEKEGREQNWLQIYFLYTQLENRQNIIRSLPTAVRNQFTLVDYSDQIIQSKQAAAETMYLQGLEYLDRGDRKSARLAYERFLKVRDIYPDYKDVFQMLDDAKFLGTNFVLLQIKNNADVILPRDFHDELKKMSLADLNSQWVQYETYPDSSIQYDYYVVLNIKQVEVSPEQIEKQTYTETKEIQDGMRYALDENGNVKKDSLGNDIRVPDMVRISAKVTESIQYKETIVKGTLDFVDLATDQLIKTENVSVRTVFEHLSATVSGDRRALSDEVREKAKNRPAAFPTNEVMLMDASELLKDRAGIILQQNRSLLEGASLGY